MSTEIETMIFFHFSYYNPKFHLSKIESNSPTYRACACVFALLPRVIAGAQAEPPGGGGGEKEGDAAGQAGQGDQQEEILRTATGPQDGGAHRGGLGSHQEVPAGLGKAAVYFWGSLQSRGASCVCFCGVV